MSDDMTVTVAIPVVGNFVGHPVGVGITLQYWECDTMLIDQGVPLLVNARLTDIRHHNGISESIPGGARADVFLFPPPGSVIRRYPKDDDPD